MREANSGYDEAKLRAEAVRCDGPLIQKMLVDDPDQRMTSTAILVCSHLQMLSTFMPTFLERGMSNSGGLHIQINQVPAAGSLVPRHIVHVHIDVPRNTFLESCVTHIDQLAEPLFHLHVDRLIRCRGVS